jgi:hypothetical protein
MLFGRSARGNWALPTSCKKEPSARLRSEARIELHTSPRLTPYPQNTVQAPRLPPDPHPQLSPSLIFPILSPMATSARDSPPPGTPPAPSPELFLEQTAARELFLEQMAARKLFLTAPLPGASSWRPCELIARAPGGGPRELLGARELLARRRRHAHAAVDGTTMPRPCCLTLVTCSSRRRRPAIRRAAQRDWIAFYFSVQGFDCFLFSI